MFLGLCCILLVFSWLFGTPTHAKDHKTSKGSLPVLNIVMQPRLEVNGVAVLHFHWPSLLEEPESLASGTLILICKATRLSIVG